MVIGQKSKEQAICDKVDAYVRQGFKKSEAVRKTKDDFMYATEAAIYVILRRNKAKINDK